MEGYSSCSEDLGQEVNPQKVRLGRCTKGTQLLRWYRYHKSGIFKNLMGILWLAPLMSRWHIPFSRDFHRRSVNMSRAGVRQLRTWGSYEQATVDDMHRSQVRPARRRLPAVLHPFHLSVIVLLFNDSATQYFCRNMGPLFFRNEDQLCVVPSAFDRSY